MPKSRSFDLRYLWIILWLGLTTALCIWWVIFGLRQLGKLGEVQVESHLELLGHQRMLIWEGLFLLVLLLGGGAALMYYVWTEKRRRKLIEEFFASFTHELKTSLASLRLQSESLQEDLEGRPESLLATRLVSDTVRIEMQLENSLFLSRESQQALFIETIELSRFIEHLRHHWPQMKIQAQLNVRIRGDARALESVFKNLLQNAAIHGKATEIKIKALESPRVGYVLIDVNDNGQGFQGRYQDLAQLFHRHGGGSGSGLGLFICKQLVERMGGQWKFIPEGQGFHVNFELPGELR